MIGPHDLIVAATHRRWAVATFNAAEFRSVSVPDQPAERRASLGLRSRGLLPKDGHIVAAPFVEVPKQRNSREENAALKEGRIPAGWKDAAKMLSPKDRDARWTPKNAHSYYGYKNHVKVEAASKLIESAVGTDAAVHDSQALEDLAHSGDRVLYADSATPARRSVRCSPRGTSHLGAASKEREGTR